MVSAIARLKEHIPRLGCEQGELTNEQEVNQPERVVPAMVVPPV